MQTLEHCRQTENGASFKRGEEGKTFELISATEIECHIYEVEKCLFKDEVFKRCDFLFVIPKSKNQNSQLNIQQRAYYIELKGDNHRTACEQLYNAIDKTKTSLPNFEYHARIISSKGLQPELSTNEFYKKVKRLIRRDIIVGRVHKGNQHKYSEKI